MCEHPRPTRRSFLHGVSGTAGALAAFGAASSAQTPPAGDQDQPRKSAKHVRIGVVGGGFGSDFQWHLHPDCQVTAVCDIRQPRLKRLSQTYGCEETYDEYREFLKHPRLDAVAVFTPPHLHVSMAIDAMKAGKHVISAVPAGLSAGELELLLQTVQTTGQKYMMAETSHFRPEVLTCAEWSRQGKFGTIFSSESEYHHPGTIKYSYGADFSCQSCHLDQAEKAAAPTRGVPTWSHGYPPMRYATHCTGAIIPVIRERLSEVVAVGWGDRHASLQENYYKSPFWNATAFFKTSGGHSARVSICWHVAAGETERASFYGDRMSYIMQRPENSANTVFRQINKTGAADGIYQGDIETETPGPASHEQALPEALRVASSHGGSHPFITHEFIDAIITDRHPAVNVWEAIGYTHPGIVAHESALKGGEMLKIKDYGKAPT